MTIEPVRRQSIIHLFTNLSITAIGFFAIIYFARVAGASVLGTYFLFTAYFSIFELIAYSGLCSAAVKRISEGQDKDEFYSASAILQLILLLIFIGLIFTIKIFLAGPDPEDLYLWLIISLIVNLPLVIFWTGNYGLGKAGIIQISKFLDYITKIVIQVIAIFFGFKFAGLAGGFISGIAISALINFRYVELHFRRFTLFHLKSLFSFFFWQSLTLSGFLVITSTDVLFIAYYMSTADVGIYRVAFQLAVLGLFVTFAVQNVLFPRFSRWNQEGNKGLIATSLAKAYTFSLALAIPYCVGGWLTGSLLLEYVFGTEFSSGAGALFILLLALIAAVFPILQVMTLNALNQPKYSFYVTAVAVVVNIALNILLIPLFGINGAAIATLISIMIYSIGGYIVLRNYIRVKIARKSIYNIIRATTVMALIVTGFRIFLPTINFPLLICLVVIGAVTYFVTLLKIDRDIHDELKEIIVQMGITWPKWL